jgi:hypothetical protein
LALFLAVPLSAQWKTPRAPGAVPAAIDLDAPAPLLADGHPDLSGLWSPSRGPGFSPAPGATIAASIDVALGVPVTDEGARVRVARQARFGRDNPRSHCLPMGIVQLHSQANPAKYLLTARELVILYEGNQERREIFLDGRTVPTDPQPFWNGYSVGRWEDDALLVDTTGFRDDGWLDMSGSPIGRAGKITERFRRVSLGRMEIDITIDDPRHYVRPFRVRVNSQLQPDDELIEHVCLENNKFF